MKRTLVVLGALGILAVAGFGVVGCKGPERAARQPISGVDTPAEHKDKDADR